MKKRETRTNGVRGVDQLQLARRLKFLSAGEISFIDDLLSSVGTFGEVRLRVEKGRLRFVDHTKSYDALKLDRQELEPPE